MVLNGGCPCGPKMNFGCPFGCVYETKRQEGYRSSTHISIYMCIHGYFSNQTTQKAANPREDLPTRPLHTCGDTFPGLLQVQGTLQRRQHLHVRTSARCSLPRSLFGIERGFPTFFSTTLPNWVSPPPKKKEERQPRLKSWRRLCSWVIWSPRVYQAYLPVI